MIVEGYFDESGDLEDQPGVFCISGYFIPPEAARAMQVEWLSMLERYQLCFFHMVDCAHGNEGFAHLTKQDRIDVVTEAIALVKKYTLEGFSILAKEDTYESRTGAPDVYTDCASGCVRAVQMFLQMRRVDGPIALFFEQGHKNRYNAYNQIATTLKRPTDTLTFGFKKQLPLLQAADLLAWQSGKYAKDYFYPRMLGSKPNRPPRKDFESLMEHSHVFLYMGANGKKEMAGIELWPLSKRSQRSVNLTMKESVDVVNWTEDDDSIPIIPVEGTIGWRPGGSQFSYIGFQGFKNKNFALGFDEPRLFEAITMFLEATGAYENSQFVPIFSVEKLDLADADGAKLLQIKLQKGATIAFHLSDDLFALLKKKLSN